jgi:hypothetical protein
MENEQKSSNGLTDPIMMHWKGGWKTLTPIQRVLHNGNIELGCRVTEFDIEGNRVESKEVWNGIISYE